MAKPFSTKQTVAAGRTKVLDVSMPSSLAVASMTFTNDTATEWEVYIDNDLSDLVMSSVTLTAQTTGGTILKKTTVYCRVTVIDIDGRESTPSVLKSGVTGNSDTSQVTASWPAVTGAVTYKVYAASQSGMESLVGETAGTSLVIGTLPEKNPWGIPTSPDMTPVLTSPGMSIACGQMPLSLRLIVFVTVTASTKVSFVCVAS